MLVCLLAFGAVSAGSVAAAPQAVAVTAPQLCAQTKQAVQSSPRYLASKATQRRVADAFADAACAFLARITPRLTEGQKALLIAGFKGVITVLTGGWLTDAEAARLKLLANQIDDLKPIAVISGPTSGTAGVALAFSGAQSSDADGTIAGYAWTWGDGSATGSGVSPSHTYATAGTYTITLVVTDNKGAPSDPVSQQVVVIPPNVKPTAVITDPGPGAVGEQLEFSGADSSDSDGSIVDYTWTWGDGTATGSEVDASHTYAVVGTYTVTLVVTDDDGAASDPATIQVVVAEAGPAGPCTSLALNDVNGQLIASSTLWVLPPAGITDCTLLQVVPEPDPGFPATSPEQQINAAGLFGPGSTAIPANPPGWTRLTPIVEFGVVPRATPQSVYVIKGVRMCFPTPAAASDFNTVRIAYYDVTLARWVTLTRTTAPTNGQICHSGLRTVPTVFSVFGANLPS